MLRKAFGFMAVAMMVCAGAVMADEYKGKITKVDADKNMITVKTKDKEMELPVDAKAKFPEIKDGKAMNLKMMAKSKALEKGGIPATVITEMKDGKEVVKEIKLGGGKPKDK